MSLYQGIGSEIKGGLVARTNQILREQADQRGGMIGGKEGTAGYFKKGSGGGGSSFADPRVQYERPYWQGLPAPVANSKVFDAGEVVYRKPVWRVDTSGGFPKLITNKRRVSGRGGSLFEAIKNKPTMGFVEHERMLGRPQTNLKVQDNEYYKDGQRRPNVFQERRPERPKIPDWRPNGKRKNSTRPG